jgi:hypothetical protein
VVPDVAFSKSFSGEAFVSRIPKNSTRPYIETLWLTRFDRAVADLATGWGSFRSRLATTRAFRKTSTSLVAKPLSFHRCPTQSSTDKILRGQGQVSSEQLGWK